MRVGTYNVLIPKDHRADKPQESWEYRKASVIETIDQGFDLIGLQECSTASNSDQSDYILKELTSRGWTGYYPWESKLFPDEFHERLPIFWRPELFTLLDAGQLLLSSWTEEELSEVPILEARYASFVKLQAVTGAILWFYTLHLQHETEECSPGESAMARAKREQGQQRVAEHICNHVLEDEAVVLGGDFNTSTTSIVLFELAGLESIELRAEFVQNWDSNSFHDWESPRDGKHIDHILFAGPVLILEAAIVQSNASDHYPVKTRIRL